MTLEVAFCFKCHINIFNCPAELRPFGSPLAFLWVLWQVAAKQASKLMPNGLSNKACQTSFGLQVGAITTALLLHSSPDNLQLTGAPLRGSFSAPCGVLALFLRGLRAFLTQGRRSNHSHPRVEAALAERLLLNHLLCSLGTQPVAPL